MKTLKLGKKAPRHDQRTLMMAKYMAATALPPIDSSVDWSTKVPNWLMLGNDTVGDCAEAGAFHAVMLWASLAAPAQFVPTTGDAIAAYSAITGYNGSAATDQGTDLLSLLNYWRQSGIDGHKINAFASVPIDNQAYIRAAIQLFGCCYIGVQLPASAMQATQNGQAWTDTTDTNIEGGHCILLVQYDQEGLTCITWGQRQRLTWDWLGKYLDEAYAVLSSDWIAQNGVAPDGFNLEQLTADLALI